MTPCCWHRLRLYVAWTAICVCALLAGCSTAGSAATTAPKASAKITEQRTELDSHGKPITVTTTREGTATGTGTAAAGDNISGGMKSEPASVTINGVTATGGGGDSWSKAMAFTGGVASNPMLYVGIACILFAFVSMWRGWKELILPALGAGVMFIAMVVWPQIILWALLALVLIVGGPYIYTFWKKKKVEVVAQDNHEALRAAVAGVEAAPPEVQAVVKAEIAKQADDKDKATIIAVKLKDNL